MRETELFKPVRSFLKAFGCMVYTEVPCHLRGVDVVGLMPSGEIMAVEMKITLSSGVIRQARWNKTYVHYSYVAVATNPTHASIMRCRDAGIGVISVRDGKANLIRPADFREPTVRFPIDLTALSEGQAAGMPCQKGVSGAHIVQECVEAYVRKHPEATRAEIWKAVPNHYDSAASMFGSLKQWHGFSLKEYRAQFIKPETAEQARIL